MNNDNKNLVSYALGEEVSKDHNTIHSLAGIQDTNFALGLREIIRMHGAPSLPYAMASMLAVGATIYARQYEVINPFGGHIPMMLAQISLGASNTGKGQIAYFWGEMIRAMERMAGCEGKVSRTITHAPASAQALVKMIRNCGQINLIDGEAGETMRAVNDVRTGNPQIKEMMAVRLHAIDNARNAAWIGATTSADADKEVTPVMYPTLTVCGESVPRSFLENMSSDYITKGQMGRHLFIFNNRVAHFDADLDRYRELHLDKLEGKTLSPGDAIDYITLAEKYTTVRNFDGMEIVEKLHMDLSNSIDPFDWNSPHKLSVNFDAGAARLWKEIIDQVEAKIRTLGEDISGHAYNRFILKVGQVAGLVAAMEGGSRSITRPILVFALEVCAISAERLRTAIVGGEVGDGGAEAENREIVDGSVRKAMAIIDEIREGEVEDYELKGCDAMRRDITDGILVNLARIKRRYKPNRKNLKWEEVKDDVIVACENAKLLKGKEVFQIYPESEGVTKAQANSRWLYFVEN